MRTVLVLLGILVVLLLVAVVALAKNVARHARQKRQSGLGKPWAIRRIRVEELDPAFRPGAFGPTLDTEVAFVGKFGVRGMTGGTSDFEAWVLSVLAKRARLLFEFGTCTGKTTYLWARNAPEDARIVTLTLAPDQHDTYAGGSEDDPLAAKWALNESRFDHFMYSGTAVEGKVTQLFGDSKAFDETPYLDRCDLIFIDGSHAYSYVVSDSAKAMRMVKPGGLVLWHDYSGPTLAKDVYRALNELATRLELVHVEGTTLVAWRRPG